MEQILAFHAAASSLNPVTDPELLYESIVQHSTNLARAEKSSLMLHEEKTSTLVIKAAKGMDATVAKEVKVKIGDAIAGKVFKNGIPLLVKEMSSVDAQVSPYKKPNYKTGSFISIPLKIADRTIGVLNISDKITGEVFSEEDMSLLHSFASYATIAIDRLNYYMLAEHFRELSITDPLTGIFNRRYFEERFFEELQRSTRHRLIFSIVIMDIDDFKLVNDSEGHPVGDDLLKEVAHVGREHIRITDILARIGGEEFAIIMPQTGEKEAFLVAERIRQGVSKQTNRQWASFPRNFLTLSAGIAIFPCHGRSFNELMIKADKVLYQAKASGKNRTIVWEQ